MVGVSSPSFDSLTPFTEFLESSKQEEMIWRAFFPDVLSGTNPGVGGTAKL